VIEITDQDTTENSDFLKRKRAKRAKLLLSGILAISGMVVLISQVGPLANSYINGRILESQILALKDPAPTEELEPEESELPYYDPGQSYFQNLVQHIGIDPSGNILGARASNTDIKVDSEYNKNMNLAISSIGIDSVNITPNIDSFQTSVYNSALKNGLAHFKGTPLPGDGGNSFIYGHSAVESFFTRHKDDPETIFSKLENSELSDTIEISKDGFTYRYNVIKKTIIDPNDFDVLSGITGKETVTLMTCWPLGVGSKRLIVIGERIGG
jgi:LPXTG-site transpeptidase (sortase) family protein